MSRDNLYIIRINFNNKGDKELLQQKVGYIGTKKYKDNIQITEKSIEITANRSLKINIKDIFYKNNNSLFNQVLKSLSYYYCTVGIFYEIERIKVVRILNSKTLEEQVISKSDFKQIVKNDFKIKQKLKPSSLKLIFSNSEKGTKLFSSITYLIKSIDSEDEFTKFEKLWKSFNPLYRMIGKKFLTGGEVRFSETNFIKSIKKFIGENSKSFNNSIQMVGDITSEELYNSLQWRNYINNNFLSRHLENDLKEKVFEFTDHRVMNIFKKGIEIEKTHFKNIRYRDDIKKHIDSSINSNIIKNDEVLSIIILNYLSFMRNKYFHGEKIDSSFRLIDNKNIDEFKWLNQIFESFIYELINSISSLRLIPKVKRGRI